MDKATLRAMLGTKRLTGDRNQCPNCGLLFNSSYAFDLHRVPATKGAFMPRKCLSPTELRDKGMSINEAGFWISETKEQRRSRGKMPTNPPGSA